MAAAVTFCDVTLPLDGVLARNTHFDTIRLRTPNFDASRFYESIGFTPIDATTATHIIIAT